jgi:hypothetical protein
VHEAQSIRPARCAWSAAPARPIHLEMRGVRRLTDDGGQVQVRPERAPSGIAQTSANSPFDSLRHGRASELGRLIDTSICLASARKLPSSNGRVRPIEDQARRCRMGIQFRVRADDSSLGGRNLPPTMNKNSFGAHEWHGVGQRTYEVYLEFERGVTFGGVECTAQPMAESNRAANQPP